MKNLSDYAEAEQKNPAIRRDLREEQAGYIHANVLTLRRRAVKPSKPKPAINMA
jgi:hypothetical protein